MLGTRFLFHSSNESDFSGVCAMKWVQWATGAVLMAGCLVALGCGDGKKTVRVKVLKDGAPAPGVALVLYSGAAAADGGVTGTDGIASITVMPGDYKVTASKKNVGEAMMDPKAMFKMGPKKGGMNKAIPDKSSEKAEELADEFTKVDKTPLSLKVPADKDPVEFTVKGK